MNQFLEILFFICVGGILYVYFGYPLLVTMLSILMPKPVKKGVFEPRVTVIIAAYNEAKSMRGKIENTLLLNYPAEKMEIIVASDCSVDGTDAIVDTFSGRGVRLCRQTRRMGKTSVQNLAVQHATGEVLVFSDATTTYDPEVIRAVAANFYDSTIGCVSGRLTYKNETESEIGKGATGYWSYETFLKERESLVNSLIGATGCLYAVRRSSYVEMYPEACSDFLIATIIRKQGLRTIYEPLAQCSEETNVKSANEWKMRVRVISQTFGDLWRNAEILNPMRYGFFAIEMISHKLLRYFIPAFLVVALAASIGLALNGKVFAIILALQFCFYVCAFLAFLFEKLGFRIPILSIPFYFVLTNLASVAAFYKFTQGNAYASWEPIRSDFEST